jgi:hypothetical protein
LGERKISVRDEQRVRRLLTLGIVAGGLLAGHALTYLVAVPDPHTRHVLLERTGHTYLPFASQAALILALASLAALAMRAVVGRVADLGSGSTRLSVRLAIVQVSAFVVLELTERWISGAGLSDLIHDHLLLLGTLTQVGTALAGVALLRWIWRAAVRAGTVAIPNRQRPRPDAILPLILRPFPRPRIPSLAGGSAPRAPPGR